MTCPNCGNDDRTMMERVPVQTPTYYCLVCGKEFRVVEKKGVR